MIPILFLLNSNTIIYKSHVQSEIEINNMLKISFFCYYGINNASILVSETKYSSEILITVKEQLFFF